MVQCQVQQQFFIVSIATKSVWQRVSDSRFIILHGCHSICELNRICSAYHRTGKIRMKPCSTDAKNLYYYLAMCNIHNDIGLRAFGHGLRDKVLHNISHNPKKLHWIQLIQLQRLELARCVQ